MNAALIKTAEMLARDRWALFALPRDVTSAEVDSALDLATNDLALLTERLSSTTSGAALHLATGSRSGVFAIKVIGAKGATTLAKLAENEPGLPSSLGFWTEDGQVTLFALPPGWIIDSTSLGDGLEVIAENDALAIPTLVGRGAMDWTFPPTYCEIVWPPGWLFRRLSATRLEVSPEDNETALACSLFNASIEHGARREDALFEAARHLSSLYAAGLIQLVEAQTQLLTVAEANGLSHTHRWFQLEPMLLSAVKTPPLQEEAL